MRKLPRLDVAPAAGLAGQHAPLPALGDEFVEQDEHPAQTEQRQISRQPVGECRIAAVEPRRRLAEALPLGWLKRPARMQQNIGGELHRIVPAKILEIEERQRPVRPSQAVVEAEIGRNEAAPFLREFGVKSKAGCRHRATRLRALDGEPRRDGIINKINQFMLVAGGVAQARQAPLNLPFDLAAVETGLGCRRLFGGPGRRAQAMDRGEENDRRVDIGIAHFGNVTAVDPAQKRIAVLAVDAEHARHRVDAMALHQPQRADFGREPVARVVAA